MGEASRRAKMRGLQRKLASVALDEFDELRQAVLGKEIVDHLAEQRLEGGVAVGGEAPELTADGGGEVGGDARLARARGWGLRAGRWRQRLGRGPGVASRRLLQDGPVATSP